LADANHLRGPFRFFFLNRGYLKLLAFVLVAVSYLPFIPACAFISFDIGYFIVTKRSAKLMKERLYSAPQFGHSS